MILKCIIFQTTIGKSKIFCGQNSIALKYSSMAFPWKTSNAFSQFSMIVWYFNVAKEIHKNETKENCSPYSSDFGSTQ